MGLLHSDRKRRGLDPARWWHWVAMTVTSVALTVGVLLVICWALSMWGR
jgi:hypothetical protein